MLTRNTEFDQNITDLKIKLFRVNINQLANRLKNNSMKIY